MTTINSLKAGPTPLDRITDERLCIWCGQAYRMSTAGADQCFCPTCNTAIPPSPRGTARIQWMSARDESVPAYADLSHRKGDPWPANFPVIKRPAHPL